MTTSICGKTATFIVFDEIQPAPRRIATFSRENKIFGDTFHYANPIMYSYDELAKMRNWCWETFGTPGYNMETMTTVWDFHAYPDFVFWFGEEKHLMLFILRWS